MEANIYEVQLLVAWDSLYENESQEGLISCLTSSSLFIFL